MVSPRPPYWEKTRKHNILMNRFVVCGPNHGVYFHIAEFLAFLLAHLAMLELCLLLIENSRNLILIAEC